MIEHGGCGIVDTMKGTGRSEALREAQVLAAVAAGRYGVAEIARRSRMSIRTLARLVARLKKEGHGIIAVRDNGSWRYELRSRKNRLDRDPALQIIGLFESRAGDLSRRHDEYLYGKDRGP